MTKGIFYTGAIPGAPGPANVEAKLRELEASCATGRWPAWFTELLDKHGSPGCWKILFKEAADELEQRSLYAGNLLRRLAGD